MNPPAAPDHAMRSVPGTRHVVNQDAVGCDPGLGLWLVADGMGGHAAAEVASSLARDTVLREVGAGAALADAVATANLALQTAARQDRRRAGMGTTIAAVQLHDRQANVVWAGDSRVYRLQAGRLACLTRDHSLVQYLVDRGTITAEEAAMHPRRHVLMSALGLADVIIGTTRVPLQAGDRLLLCSDGITGMLDHARIEALLAAAPDAAAAAEALTREVRALDGPDDASAVVIHI
ncbi:MAG: SpoIIE family protein phosphatase [Pseudomonadales bacterium]